jgi:predicted site-specific integrase-resolvase
MERVTERQMAEILEVSYRTMANRRNAGTIPFYKEGGRYWYDPEEVRTFFYTPAKRKNELPIVMEKLTGREQDIFNRLLSSFDKNNVRKVAKMISASREDQRKRYVEIFELLLGYGGHDKETSYENNMEAYMRKLSSR